MNCDGTSSCWSKDSTYHEGMWHWSQQDMHYWIVDESANETIQDASPIFVSGFGCKDMMYPLGLFPLCGKKTQANTVTATVQTSSCAVRARVTTTHQAGWGYYLDVGAGPIAVPAPHWGATDKTSNGSADYDECDQDPQPMGCDDPATPTVESCGDPGGLSEGGGTYYGQTYTSSTAGWGSSTDTYTATEVCHYTKWYVSFDGGLTKSYTETTMDYREIVNIQQT